MLKKSFIAILAVFILFLSAGGVTGQIKPDLEKKLQKLPPGEKLGIIVELKEQVRLDELLSAIPGATRKLKARMVINALKDTAKKQQKNIRSYLKKQKASGSANRVQPLWIFNGIALKANAQVIHSLAAMSEVREVRLDASIPLPAPSPASAGESSGLSEWNIELIRAPEVWALDPAYDGTGTVVGSFDTGVDGSHPDLVSRYRGNHQISWFDPYGEHFIPYDFHGHGTHTTGTAVGGSAGGTNIGVAPGATWIAAKGWDDSGLGLVSAFHQIFEWFLAPGGDPDNAPDVVNSSWSFAESGCDTEFLPDIQAWRAAGIFPAFAAGNEGPTPYSVRSPGNHSASFAVGATDYFDQVAIFSARGPSPCDGSIKPDICAPGDGILSALPGGYAYLSGTSMATPHITGAVAVLRSMDPALTVAQLETLLTAGAMDLADPGLDNSSGAGRMDLFVSAQVAQLGPDFPIVKVIPTEATATEADLTSGIFTISRSGDTDADLEVKYAVSGTADPGSDYEPIGGSVFIPAGSTTADIVIIPIDDEEVEFDETVILTILSDSAYIVSSSGSATVTIISDELIPDLVVTAFTAPATAGEGESITLTDTTKNIGAGVAGASQTRFYLSDNTTVDTGDTLIGSRSVPSLADGASSGGSTTVTIPAGTTAGSRYIIAMADGEEAMVEASETNNTYAKPIKIGADLDIIVLSGPIIAGAGQSITLNDTTKNIGAGVAGVSQTGFYLSTDNTIDEADTLLGGRSIPALAAGASSSGSTTVTIPEGTATGNWYIVGRADDQEVVAEVYETNNTYFWVTRVGADLDVMTVSGPTTAGAGQNITVTDTTKNIGAGAAGASVNRFYLSANTIIDPTDTLLGSRSVPALAAGASSFGSTTVTIPEGTATDNWYIVVMADADEAVIETSETNNTYARFIKIGPDLDVTALSASATGSSGENLTLTDTIKNLGGGAAGASQTRFYLSANTVIDATDTLLGSRSVPALAAGASNSGSITVPMPEGASSGNWYVIAMADGEEAVAETTETNNTLAQLLKIGADLDIIALSGPTTGGAGQNITVTDTTKNIGEGPAVASQTRFYLSADTVVDANDSLIGNRSVPALAGGASSAGSTTVTIPEGTTSGNWYIVAMADGEEAISEVSETNNTYARSIRIGGDLDIIAFSAPATAGAGQNITVSDTTKNIGGGTTEASQTRFYLSANTSIDASDTLLGSRSVPALAGGASSFGSTTVTIPEGTSSGNWYIVAMADGEEVVLETSETNNTYARSIRIGGDLDIISLWAPTTSGAGQSITVNDTTKNIGSGPTEASQTRFYFSANTSIDAGDTLLGSRSVPALAGGASSAGSTTITIPEGTSTGNWYIVAKADGEDAVVETSETNNTYARMIRIGPDLDIIAFSAPMVAGAGQSITVTDTVKNIGAGAAGASQTRFYLSLNTVIDANDTLIGSRSVPALAAGARSSGPVTVTIPADTATAYWYIVSQADAQNAVIETSETNNTYAWRIRIGPDLDITAFSVPSVAVVGQSFSVTDTTKNVGGGDAGASLTQYYLSANTVVDASDTLIGSRSVPALAGGAISSGAATVTIPAGTGTGYWYVVAKADGPNAVTETTETNNTYARRIRLD
jgi:subtilase family serine protease